MADLRARITADSKPFEDGLKRAKGKAAGFTNQLGAVKSALVGAFSVGVITRAAKAFIDFGSKITDLAKQSNISTDSFQALADSARRAGTDMEVVRVVLDKLIVEQGKALGGFGESVKKFEQLGLSLDDIRGKAPDEMFELLAIKLAESEKGAKDFSAVFEILGTRSGPRVLEVLEEVANIGLVGLTRKAKEAGTVLDELNAKRLDETADKLAQIGTRLKVGGAFLLDNYIKGWEIIGATAGAAIAQIESGGAISKEAFVTLVKDVVNGTNSLVDMGEAAETFRDKINDLKQDGEIFGEDFELTTEELEKQNVEIGKLQDNVDKLLDKLKDRNRTDEERLAIIDAQIKKEREGLTSAKRQDVLKAESVVLDLLNKRADLIDKIGQKEKSIAEERKNDAQDQKQTLEELKAVSEGAGIAVGEQAADRLAKIGGFSGGQVTPQARIAERNLEIQRRMLEIVEKQPKAIADALRPMLGLS